MFVRQVHSQLIICNRKLRRTWSFWKLFRYALDGFFAFSTAPLTISSILGVASCLIAFIMIIVIIIKKLAFGDPVH